MESELTDRDNPVQGTEQNQPVVGPHGNEEPQNENQTYKDTEYVIGGCNKLGSFVPDTDMHANPPPQYEMTYDERDHYPVYLRQTDDQCIQQQQQHRVNAYRYATERNKPHTNRVRMNLEPAFISTETQTYGNEDLARPFIKNSYEITRQQWGQPMITKQYGGQIFLQSMDEGGSQHNRPPFGANQAVFWKEIIDQRCYEKIPMSSYGEGLRAPEPHITEQEQRYNTQVKQIGDNNIMTSYLEPRHPQLHVIPGYPDQGHLGRSNTNIIDDGIRNTCSDHQLPVVGPRYLEQGHSGRHKTNIMDDEIRNTRNDHQLPVVGPRYPDQGHSGRYNTNIVGDGIRNTHSNHQLGGTGHTDHQYTVRQNSDLVLEDSNTNLRGHLQFPIQQNEDCIQMGALGARVNISNQNRRNNLSPNYEYQQEVLNTAMMEPRMMSRNSGGNVVDQEWYDRRTPHTNNSDSLLEQQMNLMREMFQMVSVQNAHMRDQINTRNKLRIIPEKFNRTTSFHSFMAQFENCCEINRWEEHEKLLMLRSSLTGNASAILWDLGADRQCTYEELVGLLRARYGSEGQAESFRMQLTARKQRKGETLSSLVQDIRKLITLSYPGKASEIVKSIARDAFIEALSDRDLALQVLAKEPETLEKAYQTATKLQSYKDLVYSHEPFRNTISSFEKKSSAIQSKGKVESQSKQSKDDMKEMTQAIQEMSKKMIQFGEDLERMKYLPRPEVNTSQSMNAEDNTT